MNKNVQINEVFGSLIVLETPYYVIGKSNGQKHLFVKCKCDCGNLRECKVYKLQKGEIISCRKCARQSQSLKIRKGSLLIDNKKECCKCKRFLNTADFNKSSRAKDLLKSQCKDCLHISYIKRKFNIDITKFDKSDIKCEICNKKLTYGNDSKHITETVHIDHNHTTGKFRGFLCRECNSMLGLSYESIDILKKAILYLEKHSIL